jgi:hypothetical protein
VPDFGFSAVPDVPAFAAGNRSAPVGSAAVRAAPEPSPVVVGGASSGTTGPEEAYAALIRSVSGADSGDGPGVGVSGRGPVWFEPPVASGVVPLVPARVDGLFRG